MNRKTIALVIAIFTIAYGLPAQNWQNVCAPGKTFFTDTASVMQAFRRDSLKVSASMDTTCFSYKTIRDTAGMMTCSDTAHGSVLGMKVILTHNGWFYFFNMYDDTIKVNSTATQGQSWRFCNLGGGSYITATVASIANELVLGQNDEVKLITLQAKNQAGASINHPLNQQPFKLSKHYGLVSFYDVYYLPGRVVVYHLAGKSTPAIGLQDFGWRDVYDFAIGDQFHYGGRFSTFSGGATVKKILTVLGKTVYGNHDSVDYVMQQCIRFESGPPSGVSTSFDTITTRYNFVQLDTLEQFMALPNELIPNGYMGSGPSANRYSRRSGDFNQRQVKTTEPDTYAYNTFIPGCWSIAIWEMWKIREYAPGLGCTYIENMEQGYDNREVLVYFKKGGETWGTPVATDCNALVGTPPDPEKIALTASVSPNPAKDHFDIVVKGNHPGVPVTIRLTDMYGRPLKEAVIHAAEYRMSTGGLPCGLYFWQAEAEGRIITGKIIVE